MVSSERTGMEGKAKAERDSLTQAEEEDTSVQAYCADSCRQRIRADKGTRLLISWCGPKINQGRPTRSAELIPKSCAIGPEMAQTPASLMH